MDQKQTIEIIKNIITCYNSQEPKPREDLATYLGKRLVDIQHIEKDRFRILEKIIALKRQHRQELDIEDKKLRELNNICPHYSLTYHPDPSGNNDSYYRCSICGLEQSRF